MSAFGQKQPFTKSVCHNQGKSTVGVAIDRKAWRSQ